MNKRTKALGRLPAGTMNKTEAAYAAVLESEKVAGLILWYVFEGVTLKLANNTRLTPDFAVMGADGELQMREVKGFMMDDAWVKLKVAASLFPFRFFVIRSVPKKSGGGWTVDEVPA